MKSSWCSCRALGIIQSSADPSFQSKTCGCEGSHLETARTAHSTWVKNTIPSAIRITTWTIIAEKRLLTSSSNRGLDQRIQLFVSPDGQLQVAWGYALHLKVFRRISSQFQHLEQSHSLGFSYVRQMPSGGAGGERTLPLRWDTRGWPRCTPPPWLPLCRGWWFWTWDVCEYAPLGTTAAAGKRRILIKRVWGQLSRRRPLIFVGHAALQEEMKEPRHKPAVLLSASAK